MKASTKRILKLANNPKFISGIYNYCDRWCERCPMTDRCMNFAMDEERMKGREKEDISEEDIAKEVADVLRETTDLLHDLAEEQGIDLDNIPPDPDFEKREKTRRTRARNHVLARQSDKYCMMTHRWFRKFRPVYHNKADELVKNFEMGIEQRKNLRTAHIISDAVEVINWYHMQIGVKCMRALTSRHDELPILKEFPSDADGSMKVALIGMDNSIKAWETLKKYFPDREDELLPFLALLQELRKKAEHYYPEARGFVRPGFDENPEEGKKKVKDD